MFNVLIQEGVSDMFSGIPLNSDSWLGTSLRTFLNRGLLMPLQKKQQRAKPARGVSRLTHVSCSDANIRVSVGPSAASVINLVLLG